MFVKYYSHHIFSLPRLVQHTHTSATMQHIVNISNNNYSLNNKMKLHEFHRTLSQKIVYIEAQYQNDQDQPMESW